MRKRVVVFAPHPDDEVLGCGGTIAKKIRHKNNIFIIFMTDGRYALEEIGVKDGPDPLELKAIRKEEAIKAAKVLGLQEKNVFFLDIEDKSLNIHKEKAKKEIIRLLKDTCPTEIFYPQELEYNIDHRATNAVVKEAIKKLNLNLVEYQYTIAWTFPFYLLLHILNERLFYKLMCNFLKRNLVYVDITEFLFIKKMAIKQYESQLKPYSKRHSRSAIKPFILKASLKNKEKFFI